LVWLLLWAASTITAATSLGFASITTWLVGSVTIFALMCSAIARSSFGDIARSLPATMYQEGFVCQASASTLSANAAAAIGVCVTAIIALSVAGRSCAKSLRMPSAVIDRKPDASGVIEAAAGDGG
jgi:hypothetical protein